MPDANGLPLRSDDDAKTPILNKSAYDIAKDATTIWIPALAALYSGLAIILHLPYSVEVVGVAALVVTFLGTVLKISSNQFQKLPVDYNGQLVVNMTDPEKENYKLEIDQPWNELANLNEVRIKVIDES